MAIQLSNVHFAYPEAPAITVLDIPQWSVPRGEQLFVHGPSGCGKSTLLSLISGILTPQQGEITLLDQRLDLMKGGARDRFRADFIGYVFQQFNLIPYLTAIENIELARHFSRPHPNRSAIRKSLNPENLLTELGISAADQSTPTSRLSIGQQQRVAIARAMINHPQLLIADEPTSALDKNNCDRFMSLLMALTKEHDITLLFVSHDLSLATYFNRSEALETINRAAISCL